MRVIPVCIVACLTAGSMAAADDQAGIEFFEKRIRPVLVEHCYKCHSADAARRQELKGQLQLDTRAGVRQGGESGKALVPGKPAQSVLISALKHIDFEMPPGRKLPEPVIRDFEHWISIGAPDPRDGKPVEFRQGIDYEAGRKHWAYQPLDPGGVPVVHSADWPARDIDRYILAKIEANELSPSGDAPPLTVLRRLSFDLTGLPPTREQVARFESLPEDNVTDAYAKLVDELLESRHFGEHWARHWFDGIRYDANIETSSWYRNWVIRAFNEDLPYHEFIRRQIAGSLLNHDSAGDMADNVIAGQMLIFNSREADFVEASLEVIGQQFLGISFNCAKCHDHKFDAISQRDYFALAGILTSSKVPKNANDGLPLPGTETKLITIHDQEPRRIGDTRLLIGGDRSRPGDVVPRRLPTVFFEQEPPPIESTDTSGRLELANWIGDPKNPLAARVTVNRVWLRLTGRGIVPTANDFGVNGDPPTHPRLLDHLARRLIESGGSLKSVVRDVALSRTYRLSLRGSPDSVERDYENRWFSRANARRLQYEEILDQLLFVAGRLELEPVEPTRSPAQYAKRKRRDRSYGGPRTIYLRPDSSEAGTFDGANPELLVESRSESVTAPQMMYFMNGPLVRDLCQATTDRVRELAASRGDGNDAFVQTAYRAILSRPPTGTELSLGAEFLSEQKHDEYIHALLCCNEFLYLN